jgi:hypothetical protein
LGHFAFFPAQKRERHHLKHSQEALWRRSEHIGGAG